MADTDSGSTSNSTDPCLSVSSTNALFNQISLGPALVIVLVLGFMKRRAKRRRDCCDGRPGIQVPVDFLGEENNRFSYAFAYGAMAVSVTNMFLSSKGTGVVFTLTGSPFIRVFQSIITVVCIGTIYLPIFMGLSTNAKIIGSSLGFLYTFGRLSGLIAILVMCPFDRSSKFIYWPIFYQLPSLFSHFLVLVRFAIIFVVEIKDKFYKKHSTGRVLLGEENDFEIGSHYIDHVKTLLQGVRKAENAKWYIKGRNFIYTPEPHFKYSVAILSTVIVAGIIIYEFIILVFGMFVGYLMTFRQVLENFGVYYAVMWGEETYDIVMKMINIFIISFIVSCILAALFMYFQMYRMLVSHRNHVIKLIKSDRRFLPRNVQDPNVMVGMSLRFCGYQIAYFLWGFLILMTVLVLLVSGISAAILFLPQIMGPGLEKTAKGAALAMVPTVGMAVLVWLIQQILARFVFKDRSINSKVVNLDNRRCFLLISFYFLFFNVLVGLISCILRILKGMILGVLFIGRIDRPLIMKGFTNMDTAYVAYVGFLHLQAAHKHPVVLVFSHLLWTGMRRTRARCIKSSSDVVEIDNAAVEHEINGWTELRECAPKRPRVSASALNKWFIAVTVIRNPTLIYNRKGFLKHILLGIPNSPTPSHKDEPQEQAPETNGDDVEACLHIHDNDHKEPGCKIANECGEKNFQNVIHL